MRDRCSAVIAVDEPIRIRGIDPQPVRVAVRIANRGERLSAICGSLNACVQHVHRVHIIRIGEDVHVIPGALGQVMAVVHHPPVVAAVVRPVNTPALCFDGRVDSIVIRA